MGTHRFIIDGKDYQVEVGPRSGNRIQVTVNGKVFGVELPAGAGSVALVSAPSVGAPPPVASAPAAAPSARGGSGDLRAPISGLVLTVSATPGQRVTAGSTLLVLEAMKMENDIFAPIDGVVATVAVKPQQQVSQGDLLLTITPA